VPADIFANVQRVGHAETAGKQAAPANRRTPGIQDFIKDGFNFLDITLYGHRHGVYSVG
jgi:hypothetical protein